MTASNPLTSSAMKRLAKEAAEMQEADSYLHAQPIESNLFEWHFTIRGQRDTEFENGIYHGRLVFPSNYPLSPPEIFMLTPNGVFETDKKICLSMSSYHPELWMPSWSVRTGLLSLIGFMPDCPEGVLGHIKRTSRERKILAKESINYKCPICNVINAEIIKPLDDEAKKRQDDSGDKIDQHNDIDNEQNSNIRRSNINSTFSSFVTSLLVLILTFFIMRNLYIFTYPEYTFD